MSPRRSLLIILTMAALLTAGPTSCGNGADTGEAVTAANSSSAADATAADTAVAGTSGTSGATAATDQPTATADGYGSGRAATSGPVVTEPGAELVVAVSPDGLQLINGPATSPFDFGSGRDEVVTALEAVLGTSAESQEVGPECGNMADEALRWAGQIRIGIRDDAVISWQLDRGSPLTTVSGVGLGATRAEVEDSIVIEVSETSLGTEFTTGSDGGGLSGLLTGPAPTDTVTELWAGAICALR